MRERAPDPAELLTRFRRSYRNYPRLWAATGEVPPGTKVVTPEEAGLEPDSLPADLRRLLETEQAGKLDLVKHLRIVDNEPQLVVDDDSDLPPDEELVTVSQTLTLNSADRVRVVTDIYVLRRR